MPPRPPAPASSGFHGPSNATTVAATRSRSARRRRSPSSPAARAGAGTSTWTGWGALEPSSPRAGAAPSPYEAPGSPRHDTPVRAPTGAIGHAPADSYHFRSEEHTSELQSHDN